MVAPPNSYLITSICFKERQRNLIGPGSSVWMGPVLLTMSTRFLFAHGPVSHILSLQLTASSISTMVPVIKAPFQQLILLSSIGNSECIFFSRNLLKLPDLNCSLINFYSFCNHTNVCTYICFVPCYVK